MIILKGLIPIFEDIKLNVKFFGGEDIEIEKQAKNLLIPPRLLRKQYLYWKAEKKQKAEFKRRTKKNILRAITKKIKR